MNVNRLGTLRPGIAHVVARQIGRAVEADVLERMLALQAEYAR